MVVCDANKLPILLENADQCPKLKHIIKIGNVSEEDNQNGKKMGITITSFRDVKVKVHYMVFLRCIRARHLKSKTKSAIWLKEMDER